VAIGFIASAADLSMAPLLRALRHRHPGVTFSLTERPWAVQADGLQSGWDDVAFVRDLPPQAPWRAIELVSEPLCAVLRSDHALAMRDVLGAAEMRSLAREPFLSIREWIGPVAARLGFQARLDEEIASPAALFALIRAGFGNALMPRSLEPVAGADVRLVPIAGEVSRQQLAFPEGVERPVVRLLLELAGQLFGSPSSPQPELSRS
jgi:DNA-binding transcriptional LysR family regulator